MVIENGLGIFSFTEFVGFLYTLKALMTVIKLKALRTLMASLFEEKIDAIFIFRCQKTF